MATSRASVAPRDQALRYVYNFDPARLPKIRTGLGRVRSNQGNASILCIGDSTVLGGGSTIGGTGNLKTYSWPGQLATGLNAQGVNAHANTVMGGGSSSPVNNRSHPYDPRVTVGASWSYSVNSLGGAAMACSGGTDAFSFAPGVPVDTFRIWFPRNGGLGSFTWDVNGGAATSFSLNGSAALASLTVPAPSLSSGNVLNLRFASSPGGFASGFEAWDSSKKWVSVVNAGWVGAKTGDWIGAASGYDVLNAIGGFAADLVIVSLGPNDWNTGTAVATFKANLQTIISKAKLAGDTMLVSPPASNPAVAGRASLATQALYVQAMKDLSAANGVPFVDSWTRWGGDYATMQAAGGYTDDVHPAGPGYSDIAQPIATLLARL